MPMRPRPARIVPPLRTLRASSLLKWLPAMGSEIIMKMLRMEKYSVNCALGTPKNSLTGVKKMPAHESASALGRHMMTMHEATMRYA